MAKIVKYALFIFIVSFVIYSNSLGGEFVWDDDYFVVRNVYIKTLENLWLFFANPSTVAFGPLSKDVYRPLATLSFAIDYLFWRLNAFGYHLSNVILHGLNSVLVFVLLFLIFKNFFIAVSASLFFASHPIGTETVSWISGRSNVLSLFFYLSSLIFYIIFTKKAKKTFLIVSILSCAISLFSKEMSITLPLALMLYDFHFSQKGTPRKRIPVYIPYFILTLFYLGVRFSLLRRISQFGWWHTPYATFLTMSKVLVDYMRLEFLPIRLCANYYIPVSVSIAETAVMMSLFILIVIFISLPSIFKRSRPISFSIWWFFLTLLPVTNIVPLKALEAERFLYLPSIGFCLLLAIFIDRVKNMKFSFRILSGYLAVSLVLFLTTGYSLRTIARNRDWSDTIAISKKTIGASPLNPWALASLGEYYVERGDYPEALKALKKALVLDKGFALAHDSLGFCYMKMGRYDEAIRHLEEAVSLKPDSVSILNSLGVSYSAAGRYDKAEKAFKDAVKTDPLFTDSYLNLGRLYELNGKYDKAVGQYERALSNTRDKLSIAIVRMRMGDIHLKMGLKDKALEYYNLVAKTINRDLAEVRIIALGRIDKLQQADF